MQFKDYIATLPPYKPPRLIAKQAATTTKLSSNENPLGASPKAVEAIRAAAADVFRYPDAGSLALRTALAQRYELSPDMVCCTNGSDEMVLLLCMALLREGDEVVMANGSFISYFLRTLEMGATPVRVPLRDYVHDLDAMAAAVTERTRLMFICNPNNPTGTTNSSSEVATLLQQVPEDTLVVLDEAYVEFVERDDYPDTLTELRRGRQNLLTMRTFAKIHGLAGLRLGYAFGHPSLVTYLDRARPTFNVNLLAQVAGLAALHDDEHVQRSLAHVRAGRAFLSESFRGMGLEPVPSQTNFVAVYVGDDLAITEALMDRGFTVTPLSGWGVPGHIRVSVGTDEQNRRFCETLRAVLS